MVMMLFYSSHIPGNFCARIGGVFSRRHAYTIYRKILFILFLFKQPAAHQL